MNMLFSPAVLACYANDNDALIPELWAQEGLAILEENMVMARLVHRDFSNEVASFGDVVNTRRPGTFSAKRKTDADSVSNQDAVATNVQVPLDQHVYVSFTIKDGEASKSFQDLVELYLTPAAQEIASSVDRILCGQIHEFLTNNVGELMTMNSTNAKSYLLATREKMNTNKAYAGGRNLILSPASETDLLETELFVSAEKRGDDGTALREASLGRVFGFDTYMDQNIPSVTLANTDNAPGVINGGEPLGETTIAVTILAYCVVDGEYVWLEGEGKPHVVSAATDDSTDTSEVQLVSGLVAAAADTDQIIVWKACDVDGDHASGYTKGIALDLSNAVMTEPPQVGQLLAFGTGGSRHVYTIISIAVDPDDATRHLAWLDRPLASSLSDNDKAFPGPSGSFNFAFHRNALALVTRPLNLPNTALGVRSAVGAYNDVTMRITMQYDISAQGTIVTADLLCGVAKLDENLGCIMLG